MMARGSDEQSSNGQSPREGWHSVDLIMRAGTDSPEVEAAQYALMEAGALGVQVSEGYTTPVGAREPRTSCVGVSAYFNELPDDELIERELAAAWRIYGVSPDAMDYRFRREIPPHDWLAEWKKSWQPVVVAGRFIIAAPWSEVPAAPGAHVIRIEPGMAFGTGTHETTRLCLSAIAHASHGTKSVLDVGTGTGILAIAAAKRFPDAYIEACDTDAESVEIARENARLNDVIDRIEFRAGSIDDMSASADLVIANLTADVILLLLPVLVRLTCERLVLSGILDTQAEAVRVRLGELGVTNVESLADGEWVAIIA